MSKEAGQSYQFGPFRLNLSEHTLLREGQPVPITPKVFDVLGVLVRQSGHLVSKETLLREVWPDSFVEEGALNRTVSVLRKALGDSPSGPKYIETVPKRGYRFVAPVSESPVESSSSVVDLHLSSTVHARTTRTRISPRAAVVAGALLLLTVAAVSNAIRGLGEPKMNAALMSAPALRSAPEHRQVTFTGKSGTPTISPDGRRIAYVSDEDPDKKLMVQELAGGQPLEVFKAPEVGHVRWSPDGSELMVWARGSGNPGIYIMPQLGGTPFMIAPGQYMACWSPDGSTIAVGSYLGGKIWLVNRRGQAHRTLTLQGVQGAIWAIDWSPANGRLMFVSDDGQGRYSISTIGADGGDQKRLHEEDTEIPSARWAPQGNAIYYFRRLNQTVSLNKIHAGPEHGDTAVTTLITGLETDRVFGLSSDGARLVYARAPYHSNLWMLEPGGLDNNQGAEPRQLTHGTLHIERPSVSPDGTSIVFNIGYQPLTELYTMPMSVGSPKQLTFLDAFSVGGSWSPDGKWIAFASTRGGKPRVWTVGTDGGTPRALSSNNLSDSLDLTWSAGSRILYQETGNRNYYELDPETREERPLTSDSSVGWMFSPVYSPDGRKVAVSWQRRPTPGIWVIDIRRRHETLVYKRPRGWSSTPIGWSADGSAIYVVEAKPFTPRDLAAPLGETMTEAKILRVPVKGGDVSTVASLPFEEIGSVAMTPDGRRFVFTVYSSRSDVWVADNFDISPEPRIARK
jgi:Tol biopolymer transport system component/DNA-binding winged helix-turn-helix (wHTH) protein